MKKIRLIVRVLFLIIILFLWYIGRTDIWGPLVLLGLLAIPLFGRLYCGWICPVSTSIDLTKRFFPQAPLKKYVPKMLDRKVRIILFLLMLAYMINFIKTDFGIPFFILMIPYGLIITILFSESCAHRNCLVGIIYSWLGRFSKMTYSADQGVCLACLRCSTVCPNDCLITDDRSNLSIDKKPLSSLWKVHICMPR
jgi:polyferredoxin